MNDLSNLHANAPELLQAAELTWGFLQDLIRNNPKLLTRIKLSDPKRYDEAVLRLPIAIAKAKHG